jgi:hypothetical protein
MSIGTAAAAYRSLPNSSQRRKTEQRENDGLTKGRVQQESCEHLIEFVE